MREIILPEVGIDGLTENIEHDLLSFYGKRSQVIAGTVCRIEDCLPRHLTATRRPGVGRSVPEVTLTPPCHDTVVSLCYLYENNQ